MKSLSKNWFWFTLLGIDILLLVTSLMGLISPYVIHLVILFHIYFLLTSALDLAVGHSGLLNLGIAGFFGIGAYTSVILVMNGFPFLIAFFAAAIIAGIIGGILMYATKSLKGDYLALATLGFSFVAVVVFLNWDSVTRGALGITGIPKPNIFGLSISSNIEYMIFVFIVVGLLLLFLTKLTNSPFGRLLQASRDDETTLRVLGKNTMTLKIKAMIISSALAGLAGSLFAHYIGFIEPASFYVHEIILVFTIIIVGGLAANKGPIIGTIIILIIPEILRLFPIPGTIVGPLRQVIYGLILILILLYRPRGIFGKVDLQ